MNCGVGFVSGFLRVPLMYQPCCLVPCCLGKAGELAKKTAYKTHSTVRFVSQKFSIKHSFLILA